MNTPDAGFGGEKRLKKKREIDALFKDSARVSSGGLTLRYRENGLLNDRIVVTTGRRWGKAVERNRLRRTVQEVFRRWSADDSHHVDIVVTQYRVLKDQPSSRIAERFARLLDDVKGGSRR